MKLLTTLVAATLAAPLLATPTQAADINNFVIARALTICWASEGRQTLDETMKNEWRALASSGMTYQQYQVFNAQSGKGEMVGEMVYRFITSKGGCSNWLNEPAPAPRTTIPVRGGHSL